MSKSINPDHRQPALEIGIVGSGGMGYSRAKIILGSKQANLAWVCSRSKRRADRFVKDLAEEPTAGQDAVLPVVDVQAALAEIRTHALIVCTPNTQHHDVVRLALEHGKHVLVEYPHAVSVAEGKQQLALAQRDGLVLHVGLTHRHSGMHAELLRLLALQGRPGGMGLPRAYHFMTCSGNPISRWYNRDGLSGGMFVASLYHYIDAAVALLGGVKRATAHYDSTRDAEGIISRDCASLMLEFENGCTAQLSYARGFPKPGLGSVFTIICEGGYLRIEGGKIHQAGPEGKRTIVPESCDTVSVDTNAFLHAVQSGLTTNKTAHEAQISLEIACNAQGAVDESRATDR